uniref:Alba domain-containing protein n=1 Tax=Strongyloides papillosus TaxID=174720 RepID=A0A0N5CAJ8_STREA
MTPPNNDVEMKNIEKPATIDSFKESNAYKKITQSIISVSKIMENYDSDGYSNKHKDLEKMYEKSQCEVLKTFFSNEINYIICVNYMNLIFNEFASSCAIATTENIIFAVKRENPKDENLSDENRKRVETKILFKNVVYGLNRITQINKIKTPRVIIIGIQETLRDVLVQLIRGNTPTFFGSDSDIKALSMNLIRCLNSNIKLTISEKNSTFLDNAMRKHCIRKYEAVKKDYATSKIYYDDA